MSFPSPNDIDLIVSDVDGTLLDTKHQIHERTVNAILKLREKHPTLPIVIASGKQQNSCIPIREQLKLLPSFPATHCNGAIVYGGESGGIVQIDALDKNTVLYIIEAAKRFGTFIFSDTELYLVSQGEGINKKDWCKIAGNYDTGIRDMTDEVQRREILGKVESGEFQVLKVTLCADASDLPGQLPSIPQLFP
jgi:hydroxymethylpyrimidine pyrophosphatase-like HAD family hydrolase